MEMSWGEIIGIVMGVVGIVVTIAVTFWTRKGKPAPKPGKQIAKDNDDDVSQKSRTGGDQIAIGNRGRVTQVQSNRDSDA